MTYVELEPPVALAQHVACLWTCSHVPERILPDGCADIVWTGGRLFVAGPATRAVVPDVRSGEVTVGIRFRVGAAGRALGLPAAQLLDASPALAELWADADELAERMAEACAGAEAVSDAPGAYVNASAARPRVAAADADADVSARAAAGADARVGAGAVPVPDVSAGAAPLRMLAMAVGERLREVERPDPLLRAAVLAVARPRTSIALLARRLGISERQLRRRFDDGVGYAPKTLARVLRVQRFVALAGARDADLSRLAADAGFADQAHLTRECSQLTGLPAGALLASGAGAAGEALVLRTA